MNEAARGNGQRAALTGIEGVDELWERLRDTTNEAKALAGMNRQLAARVHALERQLGDTGGLSDDELVAELPRRMARALESAQEVAEELVGRAKRRDEIIRQKTDHHASAVVAQAEAEATAILRRSAEEAVGRVNEAKAQAQAMLRSANAHRDEVLSDLQEQARILEQRIRHLRNDHGQLVRAFDVVERALGDARAAMQAGPEHPDAPLPPGAKGGRGVGRPSAVAGSPLYAVGADGSAVYDFLAPASGTA